MWLALACGVDPSAFSDIPMEDVVEPDPAIDDTILAAMQEQELVGLGVGVVEGGEVVYLRGYGWERWDDEPFLAGSTLVRWASLSKSITAALAVESQLDLDADVRTWLPTYGPPDNWEGTPLTLRLLLGHLAGARHYGDDPFDDGSPPDAMADDPEVNTGMEWALHYWVSDPLVNQPGEAFHYSSYGYNLAGVVLEHALGAPIEELAADRLFPGMYLDTLEPDRAWDVRPHRAEGYTRDVFGGIVPALDTDVSWKLASGGWQSSTADLAHWCAELVRRESNTSELARVMAQEQVTVDGEGTGYGMGLFVGGDRISHSGGNERASTLFRAVPEEERCIVLMTNSSYAKLGEIMNAL